MSRRFPLCAVTILLLLALCHLVSAEQRQPKTEPIHLATTDWPWWRDPHRNGVAAASQTPPIEWSEKQNVLWKSPIPGKGHGSPTVVGKRIFLPTADSKQEIQSVLCLDRDTGKHLWQTHIYQGGLHSPGRKPNGKSSRASSTVACDGQRLFINFRNRQAIFTTALDLDGKQLWQTKITDYVLHQGYGSSPAVHGSLVIVSADNKGGGVVAGLDRANGNIAWKQQRPKLPLV